VLTEKDVRRLRRLVATGVLQKNIAKEFGIATATVSRIATRKLWAHI
jgi:transcriptional regulator